MFEGWTIPADIFIMSLILLLAIGAEIIILVIRRYRSLLRRLESAEKELEKKIGERTLELQQVLQEMQSSKKLLEERTEELERANGKLELLSGLDGLTGIANRRVFDKTLDQNWRRALRVSSPLSLLLVDVDHFKAFNDTYGHQAGDDCLKKVAGVLCRAARRAGDMVARFGGEEFGIILADTRPDGALIIAEKLREGVEALRIPHQGSKVAPVVTISVGAATVLPKSGLSWRELVGAADVALYQAKGSGRNRVMMDNLRGGSKDSSAAVPVFEPAAQPVEIAGAGQ